MKNICNAPLRPHKTAIIFSYVRRNACNGSLASRCQLLCRGHCSIIAVFLQQNLQANKLGLLLAAFTHSHSCFHTQIFTSTTKHTGLNSLPSVEAAGSECHWHPSAASQDDLGAKVLAGQVLFLLGWQP